LESELYLFEKTGIKLRTISWQATLNYGGERIDIEENYLAWKEKGFGKKVFLENGLGLELVLNIEEIGEKTLVLKSEVANVGQREFFLEKVSPLRAKGLDIPVENMVFYRQGWQSWSASGSFRPGEADPDPRTSIARQGAVNIKNPSPGERIHLEPQLILWGEVDEVHKKYLELVGRKMKARVRGKKPSG